MSNIVTKVEMKAIYSDCYDVIHNGNVQERGIEAGTKVKYGIVAERYALPWLWECVERNITCADAIEIVMSPDSDEVTQEEIIEGVDIWRDNFNIQPLPPLVDVLPEEPVTPVVVPVVVPVVEPEPKVKSDRKPPQKSSESLSGRAHSVYERLYKEDNTIRNMNAQRLIAEELGIDCPKKKNSLRALIVKFKKNLS